MGQNFAFLFYVAPFDLNEQNLRTFMNFFKNNGCAFREPEERSHTIVWNTDKKPPEKIIKPKEPEKLWFSPPGSHGVESTYATLEEIIHEISAVGIPDTIFKFWFSGLDFLLHLYAEEYAWYRPYQYKKERYKRPCDIVEISLQAIWEDFEKKGEAILQLGKHFYDYFHPVYGFGDTDGGSERWPTREEVNQLVLQGPLYPVNFLSPAYVQKIGREVLLKTPVWKVEELSDGGILLVRDPILYRASQYYPDQNPDQYLEKYLDFASWNAYLKKNREKYP